jgi:hypothetical protein
MTFMRSILLHVWLRRVFLACALVVGGGAVAGQLEVVNGSAAPVVVGGLVWPAGVSSVRISEAMAAMWDTNNGVIESGHDYTVIITTNGAVVGPYASENVPISVWWLGFSIAFCVGLTSLGARYVHRLIAGGASYD